MDGKLVVIAQAIRDSDLSRAKGILFSKYKYRQGKRNKGCSLLCYLGCIAMLLFTIIGGFLGKFI